MYVATHQPEPDLELIRESDLHVDLTYYVSGVSKKLGVPGTVQLNSEDRHRNIQENTKCVAAPACFGQLYGMHQLLWRLGKRSLIRVLQ